MRRPKTNPDAAPTAGDAAADHAAHEPESVAAAELETLLEALAQLRLSVSADLSAAAGALDCDRPDIASDLLAGTRADLRSVRRRTAERPEVLPETAFDAAPAASGELVGEADGNERLRTLPQRRRAGWKGKVLAGAMALAAAVVVVPQVTGGSSTSRQPATVAAGADQLQLVSAEFAAVRQALTAAHPDAREALSAGARWERALAGELPAAAKNPAAARHIVTLLREERTLLRRSATHPHSTAMRAAALRLGARSQDLFTQLRHLADRTVLATLPAVLDSLPLLPATPRPATHPTTPPSSADPAAPAPVDGRNAPEPPTSPLPTAPVVRPAPTPTNPSGSLPSVPLPAVPQLPNPLPSVIAPLSGLLPPALSSPSATSGTGTHGDTVSGTPDAVTGLLDGR